MNQPTRARARDRAILRTLVGGAGLQMSIAIATLVSLPFVTRELSAAEFGIFATLTGLAVLFALADFGIGGALTTRLAELRGVGDEGGAVRAVSTAIVAATTAGLVTGLLLVLSLLVVPWQTLLGAGAVSNAAVVHAVLATALAAGLSVPAAIGQRILYGIDRGGLANLWLLGGAVLAAVGLVVSTQAGWPLFMYVLVALGAPALAGIASGFAAVWWLAPQLRPHAKHVSRAEWEVLRKVSGWYFVIMLATAASFQVDALIVASILGAADAGEFALAVRVFGLISASLTPALLQLWPAFGEAFARGDLGWIRSRLIMSTAFGALTSLVAGAVVVLVGPDLIAAVFSSELRPHRALLLALAAASVISFVTSPAYLLMNATGRVRLHAFAAIAMAAMNFPISLLLTRQIGISGPGWGTLIASVVCTVPVGMCVVPRLLSAERVANTRRT
ncbi:O-antigen/teichoic acid export membrane protein [Marmoricola sp. URHA0025 HA25]